MTTNKPKVSLLDATARGGDTAEVGFAFQNACMLTYIPGWMANESFSMCLREGAEDIEAAFFVPGHGMRREAIQAKTEKVTPSVFWQVVDRFQRLDCDSPGTYQWFRIVCCELSEELKQLTNGLRRLRDPYGFYGSGAGIIETSLEQFRAVVKAQRRSADDAEFLFTRVYVEVTPLIQTDGMAVFRERLHNEYPEFLEYKGSVPAELYQRLTKLLHDNKAKTIRRRDIDEQFDACRPQAATGRTPVLRVHTAGSDAPGPKGALQFEWRCYTGGNDRQFPGPAEWAQLVQDLDATTRWIRDDGRPRRIRLTGERRLSCAIAIGNAFCAVDGFILEMDYRGAIWSTEQHPGANTPDVTLTEAIDGPQGDDLAVSIGIGRQIVDDVKTHLSSTSLREAPILALHVAANVSGPDHANAVATALKLAIGRAVRETAAKRVHMFFAGPSHVALFLGHRLNTVGMVQCYEWVGASRYEPTCVLTAI